jgi:ribosomal protein S18 acetylase RimI-like enzyme
MSIHRVRENEIDTVAEVLKKFFTRESTEEQMKKFLCDEKNYMLVCKVGDELAGFAYGYELQRFDGRKNMMYMHQVEVVPQFQRQGIGTKLIEAFITICKDRDCGRLFLITNKSNMPAINLYKSSGGRAPSKDDVVFVYET